MAAYIDLILIHRIDMNISSILGIIFSCFLFYFIHTKTSVEMKSYKRILIQGCVVDLCYAIVTFIAAPLILLEGTTAYIVVNNFLNNIPYGWRFTITMLWAFVFTLLVPSSPVQFVYRYFVFCRRTHFTGLHFAGFLFVPISNALIYCILVFIGCFPKDGDIEIFNRAMGHLFANESLAPDVKIGLLADGRTSMVHVILAMNFITNIASYIIIFCSSYKLWKFFKGSNQFMKKSTREAQNQLTKVLVCQMLSPIALDMLPLVYIVTTMFLGISDSRTSIILNLGFSWIPFFNSCTTIFFVRPYKKAAKKLLSFATWQ